MSDALQSLWQHQEPPLKQMPLEVIRQRADQALAQERRYKLVGLVTASLLLACFGLFFLVSRTSLSQIGAAIGLSAGLSMAWRAYRLTRAQPLLPSALGIDAYRRILQREQQALTICWQTMLLVQLGVALHMLGDSRYDLRAAITISATVAPVIVIAFLTHMKAQAYRRRVQELY